MNQTPSSRTPSPRSSIAAGVSTAAMLVLLAALAALSNGAADVQPSPATVPEVAPLPPTVEENRANDSPCPLGTIAGLELAETAYEDDPVEAPGKRAWENVRGGREAARPHIQARLRGWPDRLLVDRQALPESDREFVERLARDTWRGLVAFTDRENGLPIDHVRFDPGTDGLYNARVGDYTNITNVGLLFITTIAAHEIGLVTAPEATARIAQVLDTLDHLETSDGLFFNYYDTTSLERTSNMLSFIDSAWLTAGLMVVRQSFPSLAERASRLIERVNYAFFYDAKRRQMSHGYYVHRRARSRYHYGVLYTEARLGTLIAIGKGEVPESVWFDMIRTYPSQCAGQTQAPTAMHPKTVRGHKLNAGYYEWEGLRYVPSWGGSMFEALMPVLVLDEARYAPRSLGENNRIHALVQRRYASERLGYPVWGMSPSAIPGSPGYREYGVRVLGTRGYRDGAVTPHAAALALLVTPDAALANLRRLAERYDMYGEYGFYDAVDPSSGRVAYTYLTLDQAMSFVAAANYLNSHCIQERFASDPITQRALPVIAAENFFD